MKRVLALIAMLTLTACGFEPMAGKRAGDARVGTQLAGIEVAPVPGAIGLQFRTSLEDLINPGETIAGAPQYRLRVALNPTTTPAIVAPDGSTLRYNMQLNSTYTLTRLSDGKQIREGAIRRIGAFNSVPNQYFSSFVSEQDALKRLSIALAEEYRFRLASILAEEQAAL